MTKIPCPTCNPRGKFSCLTCDGERFIYVAAVHPEDNSALYDSRNPNVLWRMRGW